MAQKRALVCDFGPYGFRRKAQNDRPAPTMSTITNQFNLKVDETEGTRNLRIHIHNFTHAKIEGPPLPRRTIFPSEPQLSLQNSHTYLKFLTLFILINPLLKINLTE